MKNKKFNVAVIGAGLAGVCAAKNVLSYGFNVTVFEQTDNIGGTWVYTDETEKDRYGLDIHSSMYSGLRTNLPKEMMGFSDYPFAPNEQNRNISFVSSNDVMNFIQSYAKHFKVESHIKFHHHVIRIRPIKIELKANVKHWEIIIKNLKSNSLHTFYFDAVLICCGHYFDPKIPTLPGQNIFKGKQLHSHIYRRPDSFKDENVLIIGSGPSAMDIGRKLLPVARKVTMSQHFSGNLTFLKCFHLKGDVCNLTKNGAVFTDGSSEDFSTILYATGYNYTFPFLSMECDIGVSQNLVHPLYQQIININHPTMGIIGLPKQMVPSHVFDIQCRFFLNYLSGKKSLPTTQEMLRTTNYELKRLYDKGVSKTKFHVVGPAEQKNYCDKLANLSGIDPVPEVIHDMLTEVFRLLYDGSDVYAMKFNIIDDKTYVKYRA